MPLAERLPPSSPVHRWPDLFELSEYDFEELCEELVRSLDGVARAVQKNRRGNLQFGVDVEGYSAAQKPFVVLSAKRERGPTKAKIGRWSNDFLKHLDGHWAAKGVERFILACADELRGDQVNAQITNDTKLFAEHAIAYVAWDRKEIVRLLRTRRDLVESYLHPAWVERICGVGATAPSPPLAGASGQQHGNVAGAIPNMSKLAALAERLAEGARRELKMAMDESRRGRAAALDAFLGRIRTDAVQWDALPDGDKARIGVVHRAVNRVSEARYTRQALALAARRSVVARLRTSSFRRSLGLSVSGTRRRKWKIRPRRTTLAMDPTPLPRRPGGRPV